MADYNKPIPSPDPYVTQPFWDGAKEGKLNASSLHVVQPRALVSADHLPELLQLLDRVVRGQR